MLPITLAHSATNARLVDASKEDKLLLQQLLSYKIDGAANFGGGEWDGRASFFDFNSSTFPAGFVTRVYREFTKRGRKVNLIRRPLPAPLGPVRPVVDTFPEDPRYDYQPQVMDLLVRFGQIIAQVATGGGKSRIAKLCFKRINRPTLFLTTRGILMHQMRDAFVADLKVPVGIFGDDNWSTQPELMNVGMVQTFAARLAEPDPSDPLEKREAQWRRQRDTVALLEKFEFLILEEAHEASSDSYYVITRLCKNAHYRLALTATPDMKDSEQANMRLEAASGPVGIVVSEKMLIERGILAKPYFKYIDCGPFANEGAFIGADGREMVGKVFRSTPFQKAYEIGIVGNFKRNAAIVNEVVTASRFGLSSMVLTIHKAHGRRLANLIGAAGVRCAFIEGVNSQDERLAAINALRTGRIDCLIGTNILDVGVDVPAVGLGVLAGGGKAEVALRQRIGRTLREKKNGLPNCAFIVDFTDGLNNHLVSHARERRAIVEGTPGFAEGIVSDFPYKQLGFVEKAA